MSDTMKRVGLWALGAMLPKEQVFARHIRHMARGVTYLVCGGMIIAAAFLAALAGLYIALVDQGLTVAAAVGITGIIALLGATLCFLLAERALDRASRLTEELKISAPSLPNLRADIDLQEGANVLAHAFLDGLLRRPPYRSHAQADLFEERMAGKSEREREYEHDKDIIRFRPRRSHDEAI
jgi:hypothetical protein